MTHTIRSAHRADHDAIAHLLAEDGMRAEGVLLHGTRYWVAEHAGSIVGAVGLEPGLHAVLLRSAIVAPAARGRGIGAALTQTALAWARTAGFVRVYCFSTDTGSYWLTQGFTECPVNEVVTTFSGAPQVRLFETLGWLPTEVAYTLAL
jgi:N-acetylglutamate synthase-like GNAT family acetyltransferase